MQHWHPASFTAESAVKAYKWFDTVWETVGDEESLCLPRPEVTKAKFDDINFCSSKVTLLDFYGRTFVSDDALQHALVGLKIPSCAYRVCTVEEGAEHKKRNRAEKRLGDTLMETGGMRLWMADHTAEQWILLPMFFFSLGHWTIVCIDKTMKRVHFYHHSGAKIMQLEAAVKLDLWHLLGLGYRIRYAQQFLQQDGYNCGVFILMFTEYLILQRYFSDVDFDLMQQQRYR